MSKRAARRRVAGLLVAPVVGLGLFLAAAEGSAAAATVPGSVLPAQSVGNDPGATTTTTLAAGTTTSVASSLVVTRDWPPSATDDSTAPQIPANVSVSDAQSWVQGAISVRLSQVASVQHQVDTSKSVTSSTQGAIDAIAQSDTVGLNGLQTATGNAGDLPTLQSIASQMVLDYRVFSVFTPQCTDVLTAEDQLADEHRLTALETALEAAIAAEQPTKVANELSARISDYKSQLSGVETTDDAALTTLLALSPSDYPDALTALSTVHTSLGVSAQAISAARDDLRAILTALAKPGGISGSARAAIARAGHLGRLGH